MRVKVGERDKPLLAGTEPMMIVNVEEPGTARTVPAVVNTWIRGADMAERTCSVDGCNRRHVTRGWCNPHYMRWYRHGDAQPRSPIAGRPQGLPLLARFQRYVPNVSPDACWPWQARKSRDGYGRLWNGTRSADVHRVAYEVLVGPIPTGLTIDHLCRNRACVNPAHLEPVTQAENVRRGVARRS